jgi:hypothetical protein
MTTAFEGDAEDVNAETETDRTRWLALYVLCGGMLMIVLDRAIWPGW